MESAAELHEARVLRARIEVKEAELAETAATAALPSRSGEPSQDGRARLAAEIDRLKAEYRGILARQADLDYRRRRAEWRAQRAQRAQRGAVARRDSACA